MILRDALPGELAEVGEIRVSAYQAGGHMSPDSGYAPVLRALGVVASQDEAEIRALAVSPEGQGQGTGSALLRAAIERAKKAGVRHLVLLTQPDMQAAQHLYQKAGFRRLPDRDWSPRPGVTLLAYGLPLAADR